MKTHRDSKYEFRRNIPTFDTIPASKLLCDWTLAVGIAFRYVVQVQKVCNQTIGSLKRQCLPTYLVASWLPVVALIVQENMILKYRKEEMAFSARKRD
jgi:hypothetical protein